jgi:hypothetical protein
MSQSVHDIEREAAEAVKGLNQGNRYEDWLAIARGEVVGRDWAAQAAGTTRPFGAKYKAALADWQKRNPWSLDPRLKPPIPSYCYWLIENLADVEAWRATLSDDERLRYNHPGTIQRAFNQAQRAGGGGPRSRSVSPQLHPSNQGHGGRAAPGVRCVAGRI